MKRAAWLLVLGVSLVVRDVPAGSVPSHGYLVVADGLKIHYVVLGHGTPVILIHGAGGSAEGNWFANGIAGALAKNHRIVAIDCRGHGKSDDPAGNSMPNRTMADDVIELMDHLDVAKAHVHGYSMGGAIAEQMLARYPERLITVAFGGWGIPETDPEMKAKVPPDKEGADPKEAELYARFREKLAERKKASGSGQETAANRPKRGEGRDDGSRPKLDLAKVKIPVLAINGEFDRPNAKTHRMQRELANFTSVVLPGKSHLSAIVTGSIPALYTDTLVQFIDSNDPK
ncbi:MAG: alpha/beta hydrolase [Planctomycetia bacterium]|nr:alpha/beta hydrolase [Planctomycetia bacterium]